MTSKERFSNYARALKGFIARQTSAFNAPQAGPEAVEDEFNALALDLFSLQFEHVPIYQRFCQARGRHPQSVFSWDQIPALPSAAFKECEVTSLEASERAAVFHSSGSTQSQPSRHFHDAESLDVYRSSLLAWFRCQVLPAAPLPENSDAALAGKHLQQRAEFGPSQQQALIILTPPAPDAPNSSLVYMLEAVRASFGSAESLFCGRTHSEGGWILDPGATLQALTWAASQTKPVLLLGTAFSFVHLLDLLAARQMQARLPPGTRLMETGGYKGRSRTVPKAELHAQIEYRLGIPESQIISEYGMSELSSQAYDSPASSPATSRSPLQRPRHFHFPPWCRARLVSPETLQEVAPGQTGLIQIFDLANLRSVLALQTEDLGLRCENGFQLIGRAPGAEARGCSLQLARAG